jgi:hypothetical protein
MTDAHIQDTIRQICNLKNTFTTRVVDRQVLGRLARELAKALDPDYNEWVADDFESLLDKIESVLEERHAREVEMVHKRMNSDDNG